MPKCLSRGKRPSEDQRAMPRYLGRGTKGWLEMEGAEKEWKGTNKAIKKRREVFKPSFSFRLPELHFFFVAVMTVQWQCLFRAFV